jgi:phosphohistidine phosphatase SixA
MPPATHGLAGMNPLFPRRAGWLAVFLAVATAAFAQSTVFVVRHADRGPEEPDAHLTARGLQQADELAVLLADAGIRHIYTTELTRTRQTAAPTAKQAGVTPVVVSQQDFDGLIAAIRATLRDGEATLVVGHRSTVPRIVKALSGRDIPPLASGEFTRILAVTLLPGGHNSVVTLRYGLGPHP